MELPKDIKTLEDLLKVIDGLPKVQVNPPANFDLLWPMLQQITEDPESIVKYIFVWVDKEGRNHVIVPLVGDLAGFISLVHQLECQLIKLAAKNQT